MFFVFGIWTFPPKLGGRWGNMKFPWICFAKVAANMRLFMYLLKDVFSFSSWWCDCPNDRSHGGVTMELPFRSRTIVRYWRFGDYLDDFLPHWSDQWWVTTPLLGWSFFRGQLLNFRVGLCTFLEECRVIRRFHDWNYPTNSEVIYHHGYEALMIPVAFKSTRIPTSSFEFEASGASRISLSQGIYQIYINMLKHSFLLS